MLVAKENRFQYVYFLLAGAVASLIVILLYVATFQTVTDSHVKALKQTQRELQYSKPDTPWHYNNTWLHIGDPAKKHMIFSAYFDTRLDVIDNVWDDKTTFPIGSLRIFVVFPLKFIDQSIRCILRYEDSTTQEIRPDEVRSVYETWQKKYAPHIVMCQIRIKYHETKVRLPQAVALSYLSNPASRQRPTFVPISYARNMTQLLAKSRPALAICVGPLQFNYNEVLRLVEFVEIYRLLGATHFYFYHLQASESVQRVLAHYKSIGVADVFDWNLKDYNDDDIHYGGIPAQFNDCVYRARVVDNFRYAAIVDLDEIILPLKHNSLTQFLWQCDEGRTVAFLFRNVFFFNKDSSDMFSVPAHTRNRRLYTQTKVWRSVEIKPAYERSKCIVNTAGVIEAGNHETIRMAKGYTEHEMHTTVGLLFHYRAQCLNCKQLLQVDYSARRFGSLLWDKVDDICMHVFVENGGICFHK